MAQHPPRSWRGSRYEKQSGCRTLRKLEPILDEAGDAINTTLGKVNPALSKAARLLHHGGCYAFHASHGRLRPTASTFPSAALATAGLP